MTIQELSDSYEVENIYQYFIESIINGQFSQARGILKKIRGCEDFDNYELKQWAESYDTETQEKAILLICE